MSVIPYAKRESRRTTIPPLSHGERLGQPEFHRRYEQCPKHLKFELIGGTVYMASPARMRHSDYDTEFGYLLGTYRRQTPGVHNCQGATAILGELSEPQPDQGLFIEYSYGGQSHINPHGYLEGPPEFTAEISYGTLTLDLKSKKLEYEKAGVLEYLVVAVEPQELHWFHFKSGRMIKPDAEGVYRSRTFPGLWIDGPALLALKSRQLIRVLRQGLKSPQHAAFVKRLKAAFARTRRPS